MDDDRLTAVLEAARMAPSTYNSQPWRFVVARTPEAAARLGADADHEHALLLVEDPARRIPVADPAGAETSISLGACLANMAIAARAADRPLEVELVEDPAEGRAPRSEPASLADGGRPVAVIRMPREASPERAVAGSPRLSAFLEGSPIEVDGGGDVRSLVDATSDGAGAFARRRSERGPYARRPLERDALRRLTGLAAEVQAQVANERLALFVTADPDRIARAQRLARRSTRRSLTHAGMARETMGWFRSSREEARRTGDGEPIDAAGYRGAELWLARRVLDSRLGPIAMQLGGAWRVARRNTAAVADSAVLLAWASCPGEPSPWTRTPANLRRFLAAGSAIETVWLGLSAERAGLQFMTNCLLFPDARREVAEIVGLPSGYVPLTLQRAGYPETRSDEPPIRRALTDIVSYA